MKNKTYKLQGLNCPSCAMLIESELEDAGIKAKCSYAKNELTIEKGEINEDDLKKKIEELGYKVSN